MTKKLLIGIFIITLFSCQNGKQKNIWVTSKIDLLVEINSFESDNIEFDYNPNKNLTETHIYVGKIKTSKLNDNNSSNKKEYYIQLNDKISQLKNIKNFVYCAHCKIELQRILINADKDTPKEFLEKIEFEIFKVGIKKNQIYYLTYNNQKKNYGYNHEY